MQNYDIKNEPDRYITNLLCPPAEPFPLLCSHLIHHLVNDSSLLLCTIPCVWARTDHCAVQFNSPKMSSTLGFLNQSGSNISCCSLTSKFRIPTALVFLSPPSSVTVEENSAGLVSDYHHLRGQVFPECICIDYFQYNRTGVCFPLDVS